MSCGIVIDASEKKALEEVKQSIILLSNDFRREFPTINFLYSMVEVASLQKHLPCVAQRTVEIRMCTCGEVHDIDIETVVQLQMC